MHQPLFSRCGLLIQVGKSLIDEQGSSMQARIVTAPPQLEQVSMSIWNTRFSRCAQVIAARRCADDELCPCSSKRRLRPLPRFAGVILMRCLLLGANTPCNRVRFTRGLGINAAKRASKSRGSKITWVVASRYGVFSLYRIRPSSNSARRSSDTAGRAI